MTGVARRAIVAVAVAATIAAVAGGCGGRQRASAPRSSCAAAAASIAQGLRLTAPDDADRASRLEPRFAEACRSSGWRPTVVRCFALARDPAEHRLCARRLEPGQRDEARVIQGDLYGKPRNVAGGRGAVIIDGCRGLDGVRDAVLGCDGLPPPLRLDLVRAFDALTRRAAEAAGDGDRGRLASLGSACEHMIDQSRLLLIQFGC